MTTKKKKKVTKKKVTKVVKPVKKQDHELKICFTNLTDLLDELETMQVKIHQKYPELHDKTLQYYRVLRFNLESHRDEVMIYYKDNILGGLYEQLARHRSISTGIESNDPFSGNSDIPGQQSIGNNDNNECTELFERRRRTTTKTRKGK